MALAARNEGKLAEAVAEIEAAGGKAAAFALDVAGEESIKACAKAALDRFGKVEILVNNAGITRDGLMLRMKRADWDQVLTTNLTGAFLLTQALLSAMLKNRWGRIVNISSVVGRTGQAGQVNYAASKAGLIGLTRSMAREVASRNVTVNAVAPGYIETPMTAVLDEKQRTADDGHHTSGPAGNRPRNRASCGVSGLGCSRVHHRARAGCERRHVHGIEAGAVSQKCVAEFKHCTSWSFDTLWRKNAPNFAQDGRPFSAANLCSGPWHWLHEWTPPA